MGQIPEAADSPPWNAERLGGLLASTYGRRRAIVIANREPCRHDRTGDGRIEVTRSASGLVTALEPVVQACAGVWVAHGCGSADRQVVDAASGVDVPQVRSEEHTSELQSLRHLVC